MPGIRWNPDIRIGDFLTLFGFALTATSLFFAGVGLRRNARLQRAQYLLNITDRFFGDNDVRRFFYRLNYNQFVFDQEKFQHSDDERWLDSLLYTFDLIGRMVSMGILTINEVEIIAFQASRVLDNPEVKKYLDWLEPGYKDIIGRRAHEDARLLADKLLAKD
jgi:hypothetical protein